MRNKCQLLLFLFLSFIVSPSLYAQDSTKPLTKKERAEVVNSVSKLLKENYVFPEVADKMVHLISANMKAGKYRTIDQPEEFAEKLTQDLQTVSKDKHLSVLFDPQGVQLHKKAVSPADSLAQINEYLKGIRRNNFGFKEAKILDGNIGYLDLRSFSNIHYAKEAAVAAMSFLSNADALIIDLRKNGGAYPSMVQFITSYFYSEDTVHLNTFYSRPTNEYTQTWTLPYVPGKRRPDIDLYILTSENTFSAPEEFAYNLKNLNRATLIGETTGGGAHPGGTRIVSERFLVWLPTGMAINPITKTNWEGTGVTPHIETSQEEAFVVAQIKALEKLKSSSVGERKKIYDWKLTTLEGFRNPIKLDIKKLQEYEGRYGSRIISLVGDKLYYQKADGPKYALISMGQDLFGIAELPHFRIKFAKEGNNQVTALQGLYEDGREDESVKDK
ncbi:S41 family peptidase [Pontibacter toksunensis]|uniref:S41 family peptidase n=1 Tax=Pontibacter toksunensis TaxID=1332631 RepID=A0ABW6C1B0_9BACT